MPNPKDPQRSTIDRVADLVLGTAFQSIETIEHGVFAVLRFNQSVLRTAGQVVEPLLKPLDALGVTDMVRKPAEALTITVETSVLRLEEKGRSGLVRTDSITIHTLSSTIDAVVDYLTESPAITALIDTQLAKILPVLGRSPAVEQLVRDQVNAILPALLQDEQVQLLVRSQAGAYITYLQQNPEIVQGLIRGQGDNYIEYLNDYNPDGVQSLIQGQSMSMAGQMMNEVRERTVTADSVVEMIVRNILRRKPREQLAPPPEEVQRRAEAGHLPSDYTKPQRNGGYE